MQNSHRLKTPDKIEQSLVWIGHFNGLDWFPDFSVYEDAEQILALAITPSLIVISCADKEQDEILEKLRANLSTALSLIFVCHKTELSEHLANGVWRDNYQQQLNEYLLKSSQVKLDSSTDVSHKLLCYLWLHSTYLLPRAVPFEKHLYDYPLLRVWGIKDQDSFAWLTSIKRKAWLDTSRLINRVRFCAICSSGHLNYVDSCPQCASIEIEAQSSLHCFNCGHIDKKENFKNLASLSCPNCLQSLRHIGVDYDRPIENQHCSSCDRLFIDADVQAECLHCHSLNRLDDLHVRNIYSYQLADAGRNLVRLGISQLLFELAPGEAMTSSQFSWLISWQNKLAIRHQNAHSIIEIEILNLDLVIKESGEINAFAQLDALKERLRSALRETDVSCYPSQNELLLFLPYTDIEQVLPVYFKLIEKNELQLSTQIKIQVKAVSLPDKKMGGDALLWLSEQLTVVEPL